MNQMLKRFTVPMPTSEYTKSEGTMNIISAREYDAFLCEKERAECVCLNKKDFAALENFITEKSDTMLDIMGISVKKGVGKVITAKNYVGVIALSDGNIIEILPKIYSENTNDSRELSRKLLLDMLNTLYELKPKQFQTANVAVEKTNVLEVFIRMYINEVFSIVKCGLNSGYEVVCENKNYYKGKVKFNEQVKYNYAHKERSYSEFDMFTPNRPENRIIKSTLQLLYMITACQKSKSDLRTLLELFSGVALSENYESDFAKIVSCRNNRHYETALQWSRVFLRGKSFSTFAGSQISLALLFPMEKLFESYIAALLRKAIDKGNYNVHIQDKRYSLFDSPQMFALRPDIVIEDRHSGKMFVMDTKWKLLSEDYAKNYGISSEDMYQMFAYSKKYSAPSVTVIYPRTASDLKELEFYSGEDVFVIIKFIDLYNAKNSIKEILSSIETVTN